MNLKQAVEESAIHKAIEKDKLALDHVRALDKLLKDVQCTLDEVVDKLTKQSRPTAEGEHYKLCWWYYFSTSDWEQLQTRLNSHIQVLDTSMQGLNTYLGLRGLGDRNSDPARTPRTHAKSIIEDQEGRERTLVDEHRIPLPAGSSDGPPSPLPLDERRRLAKEKLRLQRELLQSARDGEELDLSLLLAEGAQTEWTDGSEGMTALYLAARYGHIRVAELLLGAGADIEAKSDAFGNDWTVRTEKDRTPLIWAAAGLDCPRMQEQAAMSVRYTNPHATMQTLINCGAQVNAYDMEGWTALTECASYRRKDLVELLLFNRAQVDAKPGKGDPVVDSNPDLRWRHCDTPIIACTGWSWNEALICPLFDNGADTESKNRKGKTIAELASDANRKMVLNKLAQMGKSRRIES